MEQQLTVEPECQEVSAVEKLRRILEEMREAELEWQTFATLAVGG